SYKHWMENVKDWCISRQLWWGQRIPAWYNEDNEWVVAKTEAEAIDQFVKENKSSEGIVQEEDVLDTWFSSGLWPISVFDGFRDPDNKDINYYYPTNDLITAPEILFCWVARMMIFGHEFKNKAPFKNVYLTGIVRDKLGRKMSKSLGNSPDPLELMKLYGTDGVRVGMLLSSPAGNDLMFDVSYCEQGRNFANKIWNAFRLVKSWELKDEAASAEELKVAQWFDSRFNAALIEIEDHFDNYRLSDALMGIYKLIWDDFCAWYLEWVKPPYQQAISKETFELTKNFFERILALIHPFMPFISEELWHDDLFGKRDAYDCCIVAEYPASGEYDGKVLADFAVVQQVVSEIRNLRNAKQLSPKTTLPLAIHAASDVDYRRYTEALEKMANVADIRFTAEKPAGSTSFLVGKDECYVDVAEQIDVEAEKERINKEIDYLNGFLKSVNAKLANERFVQNAKPEIVANER